MATAAITGTVTESVNESAIVAGAKTFIITLTGDTWITTGVGAPNHTFVNKSQNNAQTGNPISITHTPGAAATGVAVSIVYPTSEIRAGGAPTIDGTTATDSGQGVIGGGSGEETKVEVWYVLKSFAGTEITITIPNTNADTMHVEVVSFKAATGYVSEFDASGSDSYTVASITTTSTPDVTTTVAGDFIYARLGCGEVLAADITEAQTLTYENEYGTYSSSGQYMIKANTGAQEMAWTFTDDHASIAVAFKAVAA